MTRRLTSEEISRMAELYPNHSNKDVADIMGVSVHTVDSRAQKHRWRKTEEYKSKLRRDIAIRNNAVKNLNSPESYEKRNVSVLELFRSEKIRVKWGLPQQTKRHFRLEPRGKMLQRNRLKRLGYIIDEANLIAYYTPGTHRATRIEAIPRGTTKGSIHTYYDFRPYGERELD